MIYSHNLIREFIPVANHQNLFDKGLLEKLHSFVKYNKIYYKQQGLTLSIVPRISKFG